MGLLQGYQHFPYECVISLDFISVYLARICFSPMTCFSQPEISLALLYITSCRPLPSFNNSINVSTPFYSYEFILSSVAVYFFPIYFSHLLTESSILADSFTVNMSKPVWGARGTAGFLTLAPVLSNISSVFAVRFFGFPSKTAAFPEAWIADLLRSCTCRPGPTHCWIEAHLALHLGWVW